MNIRKETLLAISLVLPLTNACAPTPQAAPPPPPPPTQDAAPVRTSVTDLSAFKAFIVTLPTPDALRARYPGLLVIMPDDIATRELRGDNSRYFVELDAQGRVAGGKFQ